MGASWTVLRSIVMGARELLRGLAHNPALPSTLVDRLIAQADDDLADELAQRPDLDRDQIRALVHRSESALLGLAWAGRLDPADVDPVRWPEAALALLDQGRGRAEWAELLAGDPDPKQRERLAACPGLPTAVSARLAEDPDPRVVAELAIFTADRHLLTRLAGHPHAEVRAGVAGNPAAPPEVLAGLVTVLAGLVGADRRGEDAPLPETCDVCVREPIPFVHDSGCPRRDCELPPGAARDGTHESVIHSLLARAVDNLATPVVVAAELVGHASAYVRRPLAARPDLPVEAAVRLADDPNPGVRADLAENPAVPEDVLRRLAADENREVRRRVIRNPNVPLDLLTRTTGGDLLPRIAAATPDEIRQLAGSPDPQLRMPAAERRDLPPEIRDRLAADQDAKVAKAVAPHPGITEDLLRTMVSGHGVQVLARVAANPDASPALLLDLARHVPPAQRVFREIVTRTDAPAGALELCLTDGRARLIAAAHPSLPVNRIVALLGDADGRVVTAAATNPSLPLSEMEWIIGPVP
ncbi:hypothetical protein BC793_11672 [Actinoplanes xinjiangensis]|uniref:Leucine rich repeat (LRR) protein n=2 Tax=Actinoplanes xinjiangensis TaxID=512350 RepID=A0A316F7U2_9ACTN|nr:hypothetical protein BC793_11672 [Actinoplanes xinjiangensis]